MDSAAKALEEGAAGGNPKRACRKAPLQRESPNPQERHSAMAIKGPSLSKEITTAPVINKDPASLAKSYAYSVLRGPDGQFVAAVAELPALTCAHANPIGAQDHLKKAVLDHLASLAEDDRPGPVGIANKMAIDRAKEVPRGIRKAFGKAQVST